MQYPKFMMKQFILPLSFLVFIISSSIAQQKYKPKDGGADSVVLNIWGTQVKGFYTGQYIKKVNGEKGFYPHGTGKLTAVIEYIEYGYSGDFSEGKITGSGELIGIMKGESWVYEGALVDGMANGIGKIIYNFNKTEDLAFREGTFVNGKLNGKGKTKYNDGSKYEGDHVNNIFQGEGKFIYPEGKFSYGQYGPQLADYNIYIGQWASNQRNGVGTTFYINGEKLEGNWENDMFNGLGSITDNLGRKYEGNFKNGKESGEGTLTNPDGSKMKGMWTEGKFTGFGTDIYSNGNKYVGDLVNGVKYGRGKYYFKNGAFYDGEWNDYFVEGTYTSENGVVSKGKFNKDNKLVEGKKTWPDGDYYEGIWNETEEGLLFSGTARRIASNGSIWEGEWMGNGPFLQGVVTFSNKDIYKGHWSTEIEGDKVYWVIAGLGKLSYANGNVYSGEFENSLPHGEGMLTMVDGTVKSGTFRNGVFLEPCKFETVKIGNKIWMKSNLDVSTFNNGEQIQEAKSEEEWNLALTQNTPAFKYYKFDPSNSYMGKYYNVHAINDIRGIIPNGYYLPSSDEWNNTLYKTKDLKTSYSIFYNYVNGESTAYWQTTVNYWTSSSLEGGYVAYDTENGLSYGKSPDSRYVVIYKQNEIFWNFEHEVDVYEGGAWVRCVKR